jgi:CRP/FNR family transcriptional regulator, cyclic AMP receptor protein
LTHAPPAAENRLVLRKNAKVELIRRVPLFERCSKQELGEIAGLADEIDLPAGRVLTREGATGSEFVVLVTGAADVQRGGRTINSLQDGDFLGEISLVTGNPRSATVTTTAPSRLLVIHARDFKTLLRHSPSIQAKVLDAVATRLPAE